MLYGMYDTDSPDEEVSLLNVISKVKDSNMTWTLANRIRSAS